MKYVIRLDVEVEADDQEGVGDLINQLATCGLDVVLPEHFQWRIAQLDDGLDDADLEKTMSQAVIRE